MNDLTQARRLIKECQETQNPYLDLGSCGITNLKKLPELFECKHIETLILVEEWQNFKRWTFEKTWDIWERSRNDDKGKDNNISSIPDEISNLKKLTKLILCYTHEISDISFLEKLTNLRHLDLGANKISDISILKKLTKLQNLYLNNNYISDISFLENLTGLQYLNLYDNQVSDISYLKNLTELRYLKLNSNKISDISYLENLKKLQYLELNGNQISDIRFLENLKGLQYLNLNSNQISNISYLKSLTQLQTLYLNDNQISNYRFLANLTGLESLSLRYNQISDYNFITNLTALKKISLEDSQISDISFLENLTELKKINLENNQIKKIPKSIFQLKTEISFSQFHNYDNAIYLYDNPIESPPMEIIKQGKQSVFDWFEATRERLNEIKIILIGEPKAGKTSLLRRLKDDTFNEKEVQTDGVNIEDITFGKCNTFKEQTSLHDITGHFWDFGGQEFMKATHQFFFTRRTIYVLVLEARKDRKIAEDIRDWVKQIMETGGNSPIIVLANQIDVNTGFGFKYERELQDEFPQIIDFIPTSCKKENNEGIKQLKDTLAELIPTTEFFQTEIDERWIRIKNKLQKETNPKGYLSDEQFIEICNDTNLKDEREQKNAINFLHDLGYVLHFEKVNPHYFVLDPYWITYGVYQIITSKFVGDNKGKVCMYDLEYIVNKEEDKKEVHQTNNYRKITYTDAQRRFLIDILERFKLCFRVPDNQFIIPDLLDTKPPDNIIKFNETQEEHIKFVYQYDPLPEFVIPNIMVERHRMIDDNLMWRTGCVLQYDDCKAFITSDYNHRISITVIGEHKKKREFMAVIRYTIDTINQRLSNKPKMLIPLPERKDEYADYEELIEDEKDGEEYYIVRNPKEKIKISKLLDGILSISEVKKISEKLDKVLEKGDETYRICEDIQNKLDLYFNKLVTLSGVNKTEIIEAIETINEQQTITISNEVGKWFEAYNEKMEDDLRQIYNDLKKTDDVQMKLKLSIPFIKLLGVDFVTEFNVKNWAKKMYEKHELKIFKLMGLL